MANITYDDKSYINLNAEIPATNKVMDTDMNEIKSVVNTNTPPGLISIYAGNTTPTGWLICDGSAVSRTTYANLFSVIGTTYGTGDGSTTFNLPNFKGNVPVGLDSNDTSFDTLGETGGEKTHTLIIDEMPKHRHTLNFYSSGTGGNGKGIPYNAISNTLIGGDNAGCNNAGGDQPHNNLQPYIVMNYIISY